MELKDNGNNNKINIEESNILKIPLNINEDKYLLKIYPSNDNINIVFKLEKEKIQTYYYYEKFDLKDFRQTNKTFISDVNIRDVFLHLKDISKKSIITLEKKEMKVNITFKIKNEEKYVFKFILRKKIVAQERLNSMFVEQIEDNKAKINTLKKQIARFDNSLQSKNNVISNINKKIANINNILNNLSLHSVNNSNSTKNSSSNEDNSETASSINNSNNNDDKENDDNLSNNPNLIRESDSKRGKKNKKKNKKIYKNPQFIQGDNKKNNNNNDAFCFENLEIFQNKKVIELLIILNVVTILIVMYILGSLYNLKTNLDYDKIKDDDIMNKLAYLSFFDDSNEEDYINYRDYRDIFRENMDLQLKKKEEERITSSKMKDEYLDDRQRKIMERKKRNNKF